MDPKYITDLELNLYNGASCCSSRLTWLNERVVFAGRRSTRCLDLEGCFAGKAARYFNQRVNSWWKMSLTLGFVMDKMVDAYRIVFSKQQSINLFAERKDKGRT